jgi:hypothetical protein
VVPHFGQTVAPIIFPPSYSLKPALHGAGGFFSFGLFN